MAIMYQELIEKLEQVSKGNIRDPEEARKIMREARAIFVNHDENLGDLKAFLQMAEDAFIAGWADA